VLLDFPKTLHVFFRGINPLSLCWILKDWSDVTPYSMFFLAVRNPANVLQSRLAENKFNNQ